MDSSGTPLHTEGAREEEQKNEAGVISTSSETHEVSCSQTSSGDELKRITEGDVEELKGCMELGFRFSVEEDHGLCRTFPALKLYYAINRTNVLSGDYIFPIVSGSGTYADSTTVKTRLKQWARIVACSVRQFS